VEKGIEARARVLFCCSAQHHWLLELVCHKAISPSVPYKVSPSHKKEAESIWVISKGKNFLTLEFGDVSFICDFLG